MSFLTTIPADAVVRPSVSFTRVLPAVVVLRIGTRLSTFCYCLLLIALITLIRSTRESVVSAVLGPHGVDIDGFVAVVVTLFNFYVVYPASLMWFPGLVQVMIDCIDHVAQTSQMGQVSHPNVRQL